MPPHAPSIHHSLPPYGHSPTLRIRRINFKHERDLASDSSEQTYATLYNRNIFYPYDKKKMDHLFTFGLTTLRRGSVLLVPEKKREKTERGVSFVRSKYRKGKQNLWSDETK